MTTEAEGIPEEMAPQGDVPTYDVQPEQNGQSEPAPEQGPQPAVNPKVVHRGTLVQAVFGVVDKGGNAPAQEPVSVQIHEFTLNGFVEAYHAIKGALDNQGAELIEGG